MSLPLSCVVTTIQNPTASAIALQRKLSALGCPFFVIGDRKGPDSYDLPGTQFFSLARQKELPYLTAPLLPEGHYARKNLGYLLAIEQGADCIYETDDDNHPNQRWAARSIRTSARKAPAGSWNNVYQAFTTKRIWPRGYPLELLKGSFALRAELPAPVACQSPIQQGLADLSPDVDAVWRLVLDEDFHFDEAPSVLLPPGSWCPFNSQSTWWWPEAYPLLYLPSHCSIRVTDIWRSFVAQRCLWELGHGVIFHAAEATQQRNEHNLLRDFMDEVPGYQHNAVIARTLDEMRLEAGPSAVAENLVRCYESLVLLGVIDVREIPLVRAWTRDLHALRP